MTELTLDDRKKISIQLLDRIHEVCSEQHITYYLAYGSLLGSVRHKGFIPWDDDIDIWVPIWEIDRLLDLLSQDKEYSLIDHRHNANWDSTFSKFCDPKTIIIDNVSNTVKSRLPERGIAIDIFPLISIKSKLHAKKLIHYRNNRRRQHALNCGAYKRSYPQKQFLTVCKKIGHDTYYYHSKLLECEREEIDTDYLGCPISPYEMRDIHKKECFLICDAEFEGKRYNIPVGYDAILTKLYGDYMTPPSKDKQISNHEVKAFLK